MSVTKEMMRPILLAMFKGWEMHQKSFDGEKYTKDKVACMIEASGGDENIGYLIYLFDYWGNDIQSVAAELGVGWDKDGNTIDNIPPKPTPGAFMWKDGMWQAIRDAYWMEGSKEEENEEGTP